MRQKELNRLSTGQLVELYNYRAERARKAPKAFRFTTSRRQKLLDEIVKRAIASAPADHAVDSRILARLEH